jgi:hypothetical protein
MKSLGFIMYIFIFLLTWAGLTVGGWGMAQQFSAAQFTPWIITLLSESPHVVSQAMGGVIAIGAAFALAMLVAVVLFTLVALLHRFKKVVQGTIRS